MKYLVIGTGGVGGSIAAFLHLAGKDVSCIARGKALDTMRRDGMKFHSTLKGEHIIPVDVHSAEDYNGKADVIFVTVKGYSIDDIGPIISKCSGKDTIVIPLLNVYGTGARIAATAPDVNVLDGCIYIVGFKSGTGEITQMGEIFHIVYGVPRGHNVDPVLLDKINTDLTEAGIKVTLSDDIDRDTFIKWSFISAMALTGAYYDIPMGPIQHDGPERNTFIGLDPRKTASILDTCSCIVQSLIPYGAQTLLATSLADISPAAPWTYMYYSWMLAGMVVLSIVFKFPRRLHQ